MKMKRLHTVPLTRQMATLLHSLPTLTGNERFLFQASTEPATLATQLEDGCADWTDYSLGAIMRQIVTKLESGEAATPCRRPSQCLTVC